MSHYRQPAPHITQAVLAPANPTISFSPDRKHFLAIEHPSHPSLDALAKPFLKLAGSRWDPTRPGYQTTLHGSEIRITNVATGQTRTVTDLPAGIRIDGVNWSPDSNWMSVTADMDGGGIGLYIIDVETLASREVTGLRLKDSLAATTQWLRDSSAIYATAIPDAQPPFPQPTATPDGPNIQESHDKRTRTATYQDLLTSPHDEACFAHIITCQLVRITVQDLAIERIGEPVLLGSFRQSPDGNFLLVTVLQQPFSYRVPVHLFARSVQIWTSAGDVLRTICDIPMMDEIPPQGVPVGPRGIQWVRLMPATLLWTEALDGGDPKAEVPHRDRLMLSEITVTDSDEPREIVRLQHRFADIDWLPRTGDVILTEYDRDRRWRTSWRTSLFDATNREELWSLSVNDAYNDPGDLVYETLPDGTRVVRERDGIWFLTGRGATAEGDRPFLTAFHPGDGISVEVHRCGVDAFETFVGFSHEEDLILSRQDPATPPNLWLNGRNLTSFVDPHPDLTGMHRELVRYKRSDGVQLTGTLFLPPGHDPKRDGPLPTLFWAYPEEYSDPATAGQVRGSDRVFTRLAGTSPVWFAAAGWAVLADASVPVIGDPDTMNDTFAEQIVDAAKSAVDMLVSRGISDPHRIVCGGHSYGAFMTANLLAHAPGLFSAGIARSGAYNRTLTPFGFQSERRTYWEAQEIYHRLSPFTYADKITDPILLIHGAADNNPGTHTQQSERFYQALAAHGATVKLVLLPHESHGYRAAESILHTLAEMLDWANTWSDQRLADRKWSPVRGKVKP